MQRSRDKQIYESRFGSVNTLPQQQTRTRQWYSNRGTVFSVVAPLCPVYRIQTTIEDLCFLCSPCRCYKLEVLELSQWISGDEKTRRLVGNGLELFARLLSSVRALEAEECPLLEVVAMERLVKTQQAG
jgi:hypothetical protein